MLILVVNLMCLLFILSDCLPNTPIPNCNQECCEDNGEFRFLSKLMGKKKSFLCFIYKYPHSSYYLIEICNCIGCEVCISRRVSLFGTFWICEGFDIGCCIAKRKIEV